MYLIIPYSKKLRQHKSLANGIQFAKVLFTNHFRRSHEHIESTMLILELSRWNWSFSIINCFPQRRRKHCLRWIWPSSYVIRISLTSAHGYILWYTTVATLKSICIAKNINGNFCWMRCNKAGIKTLTVKALVFQVFQEEICPTFHYQSFSLYGKSDMTRIRIWHKHTPDAIVILLKDCLHACLHTTW